VKLLEALSDRLARLAKVEDLRPIENTATRKLAALFELQGKLMLDELSGMRGYFTEGPPPSAWEPAWDRTAAATEDGFTVVERSMLEASMALGATKLSDDLTAGVSWDLKNPRAVAWLEQRTTNQVAGISETSKGYINTVMTKAVDKGWSYDRTARELTARFEQFAVGAPQEHIDSRAHLIAVTESASAYEQGTAQMIAEIMEAGVPMEKAWLDVGDERVCEICEGNADEGWIPAEASFSSGDSEPPSHPADRCTTLYQVAEVVPPPEVA
jgi:hypothetical protein